MASSLYYILECEPSYLLNCSSSHRVDQVVSVDVKPPQRKRDKVKKKLSSAIKRSNDASLTLKVKVDDIEQSLSVSGADMENWNERIPL